MWIWYDPEAEPTAYLLASPSCINMNLHPRSDRFINNASVLRSLNIAVDQFKRVGSNRLKCSRNVTDCLKIYEFIAKYLFNCGMVTFCFRLIKPMPEKAAKY